MKRAALGLLLALAALTLAYATSRPVDPSRAAHAQTLTEPLGTSRVAKLEIHVPAADVRVDTRAGAGHLFDAQATPAAGRLVRRLRPTGPLVYELQAPGRGPGVPWWLSWNGQERRTLDLALNPAMPTELALVSNVGEMKLNLRNAALRRLKLQGHAGDIGVILPARGQYRVHIASKLGEVAVVLPTRLAARVTVRQRLGDLSMPQGFTRRGDVYTSAGYAQAAQRVDLTIEANLGDVAVSVEGE
ncbi:hypothetical protein [Deinococcus hopiensis]|uniref:DUF2154 domain-containing protein n=1 Tax=Deinococcus hopiensis KR-140 TaxID=695939 RepID=A0A1W1VGT8_9DEIO|nr:hypothetical protein [Deinococcus hopiensis]SMB92595.1 hypothetical protein SAMN00790413_01650 [Deinococcus hopiensis KR-140]